MPEEVRPVNRKEAIIAGESVTPVTREEYFLKVLAGGAEEAPADTTVDPGSVNPGVVNPGGGK